MIWNSHTPQPHGPKPARVVLGRIGLTGVLLMAMSAVHFGQDESAEQNGSPDTVDAPVVAGMVRCANLIYGDNKTSVCFSSEFLKEVERDTHIVAHPEFVPVRAESAEMYEYPFVVMTGEGAFTLTDPQRTSLRNYLTSGGFLVASAGCSSRPWASSFRQELQLIFPELELQPLDVSHPVFHTVYDVQALQCKKRGKQARLQGLEIDGKIVLIFSSDGLNDTANAGGNCCCCGGNEIRNARQMNVNLLAYTLTH